MLAAYAVAADAENPLTALRVGEIEPPPCPRAGCEVGCGRPRSTTTTCGRCAGSGLPADRLPMILGCDAAGVTATAARSSCTR